MSISGALSNAVSGLIAASRSAEIVSTNVANVMTEGYGHRSVSLSSRGYGGAGGVGIDGITRRSDPTIVSDRRQAEAEDARSNRILSFLTSTETLIGIPGEPGSLSSKFADFEASLVAAASMPNAQERLQAVSYAALGLTEAFNGISQGLQDARKTADQNIGHLVNGLNTNLKRIENLNQEIAQATVNRQDTSSLLDERQRVLDDVSKVVPLRLMNRDNGQIGVYSTGGVALVDGSAAHIDFAVSNEITPHQSIESQTVSGLVVNGVSVEASEKGGLAGGLLQAEFQIRDKLAVSLQNDLDALARDLVEKFQSTVMDPSLTSGSPGVFTDGGVAFTGPDETGLAGRLSINSLVDATKTTELWRLRDGLGAAGPGPVSSSTLFQAMSDQLVSNTSLNGTNHLAGANSSHAFATQLVSVVGSMKAAQEGEVAFASARLGSLVEHELSQGVNTDQEMQKLLLIEQTYAANARVIQVVDELMQTLLGL